MAPTQLADIRLAAGDTLHLPLPAGTVLWLAQGRAQIDEAPRWLAECLVPVGGLLSEGEAYTVTQTGWVRVHGQGAGPVQLQRLVARPPARRAWPWWLSLRWLGRA